MSNVLSLRPRRCPDCNAPRKGMTCWKCGTDTFLPDLTWVEPAYPDVEKVRKLCREMGYALAEHGSRERDIDLVAVPWVEDAVGPQELVEHVAQGLPAIVMSPEWKPHKRYAVNLQMEGWFKLIDLSVAPRARF